MVQGLNSQNTTSSSFLDTSKRTIDKVKTKAVQLKDIYEKSDNNTKSKVNIALAGGSVLGSIIMLIASHGKKAIEEVAKNGKKNIVRKQNKPLKWLGAIVSLVSSVGLIALNIKLNNATKTNETKQTQDIQQPQTQVAQQSELKQ